MPFSFAGPQIIVKVWMPVKSGIVINIDTFWSVASGEHARLHSSHMRDGTHAREDPLGVGPSPREADWTAWTRKKRVAPFCGSRMRGPSGPAEEDPTQNKTQEWDAASGEMAGGSKEKAKHTSRGQWAMRRT
ncbi:hypothetical protein CERSUDRAFT_115080 [Gelatoporia subvermispora B]|uniref:Uncharacterized protein n=1 Tax=Ceriporiopsis subvermispora (strain B) TaxID=914234 RepID=M2REA8_CERS8|nr:hypothetical protein CERSUDRAFT_115080 [Gelatoporia subvermispora B]